MAAFTYAPLDRSTRNIRLLSFEDEDDATAPTQIPMRFRLETYDLDARPEFVALSYTWGPATAPTRRIIVNGRALRVRDNLHSALWALRTSVLVSHARLRAAMDEILRIKGEEASPGAAFHQLRALLPEDRWHTALAGLAQFEDPRADTGVWELADIQHILAAAFSSFAYVAHDHDAFTSEYVGRLRRPRYWIDAICINQDDDRERGHQVNMMSTIYSQAEHVIARLDSAAEESDSVPKMLVHADGASSVLPELPRVAISPEALYELKDLPYWTRMWIVQEFALAQRIIIFYGRHRLRWGYRGMYMLYTSSSGRWIQYPWNPMLVVANIRHSWQLYQGQSASLCSEMSLDGLIRSLCSSRCSDARDSVYALLALTRTRSSESIPLYPDYTISPWRLYYRVLASVRYSPSLSDRTIWEGFRATLRKTLRICPDEILRRNELLYQVTEHERHGPHQKPLLLLDPAHRAYLGQMSLRELTNYFQRPFDDSSKDSQQLYGEITQLFEGFPKHEDPGAWHCFENLLKGALGLEKQDTEAWGMFIDFQDSEDI